MADKTNENGLTFADWGAKVDDILSARIGFSSSDLADFASYDLWESGASPQEGAEACLEGDDTFSGLAGEL